MTHGQPTPPPSGLERLIDQAREDLARRSSTAVTEIRVVEAAGVVWPDSSIGCPQPGMAYLQVPEDGARIVLEAEGTRFEYHYGGRHGLFLCDRAERPAGKDPDRPPMIDILDLPARNGR
jgi:hypothetical protein